MRVPHAQRLISRGSSHKPSHMTRLISDSSFYLYIYINKDFVPSKETDHTRARAVNDAVSTYSKLLPRNSIMQIKEHRSPLKVAVINSTGYSDSYLIAVLLRSSLAARLRNLDEPTSGQISPGFSHWWTARKVNCIPSHVTVI
ncbi:hypothetical protein F5Y15DRAFT_378957, partial [Xylariaceae sp. FL0016]